MERTNVSEQRALQMYKKTNKYRSEYYNHNTYGGEWRDPMNYDLVLNSYKVGIDNCVKLIVDYGHGFFASVFRYSSPYSPEY